MGFISNLPNFSSNNEKELTLKDIAKCKGSGSLAAKFVGQMETLWKTGSFVTDKTVAEFVANHSNHMHEISTAIKNLSNVDTKQLQSDQAVARRLAKVFAKAAPGFNADYVVLRGLKALDQYDPGDLLKAAVFEKVKEFPEEDDLKSQFISYIKNRDIQDEAGLKTAYQDFKNKIVISANNGDEDFLDLMRAYPEDRSLSAYAVSLALADSSKIYQIQSMSISELMQALDSTADRSVESPLDRFDPVDLLKAAVYRKLIEKEAKDDLKSLFAQYVVGKEIKDEAGLKVAYAEFQKGLSKADLKKYAKDESLNRFNSKIEKIKSSVAERIESEDAEFEEVDLGESSSDLSEVKEMGVEELMANLKWGSK